MPTLGEHVLTRGLLERILSRRWRDLARLARSRGLSAADAEDVVQAASMRVSSLSIPAAQLSLADAALRDPASANQLEPFLIGLLCNYVDWRARDSRRGNGRHERAQRLTPAETGALEEMYHLLLDLFLPGEVDIEGYLRGDRTAEETLLGVVYDRAGLTPEEREYCGWRRRNETALEKDFKPGQSPYTARIRKRAMEKISRFLCGSRRRAVAGERRIR